MSLSVKRARRRFGFAVVLTALTVTGCAGLEPYEHHDEREKGPKHGLFSGEDGEFVIFRSEKKPAEDEDSEEKKGEKGG